MACLRILQTIIVAALMSLLVAPAHAQQYPSKPIRILVGYVPGGPADLTARIYAEKLQDVLNTPVIVENRPGAFEQLAAQVVVAAPPDGYTLWLGTAGALTMGPGVRSNIPYDVLTSFTHVAKIGEVEAVLSVRNDLPVNSLPEFISYAKSNPDTLFYSSAGMGSGNHLLTEYIMSETGIKLAHIPYKGDAEVVNELAAGRVDFGIPTPAVAVPFIKEGKFKAIAVTGSQRLNALPDVPTVAEGGIESLRSMGVYSIYGLLGPADMPPAVTQALSDALNQVAQMPEVSQRLESIHVKATTSTPAELRQYLESEGKKWHELGKTLNISLN